MGLRLPFCLIYLVTVVLLLLNLWPILAWDLPELQSPPRFLLWGRAKAPLPFTYRSICLTCFPLQEFSPESRGQNTPVWLSTSPSLSFFFFPIILWAKVSPYLTPHPLKHTSLILRVFHSWLLVKLLWFSKLALSLVWMRNKIIKKSFSVFKVQLSKLLMSDQKILF